MAGVQVWRGRRPAASGMAVAAMLLGSATSVLAADVAVTWTRLLGSEESGYTRLHVYLTNRGKEAALITGAHVNGRYVDLVASGMPMSGNVPDIFGMSAVEGAAATTATSPAAPPPGKPDEVEWRRAAFNPIPAGKTGEVTILLRGAVKQADVRVAFGDGASVPAKLTDVPNPLRLSCVAFDPAAPGKTYIYCVNDTQRAIEVDHVVVNGADIREFRSIPVGAVIEPGAKSCLIAQMAPVAPWGSYIDVGVVGRGGERVWAVLRVMSHFPICEWKGDTRPEMFLDSIPGFLQKPDERVEESPDRYTLRPWRVETDVQARNGGRWRATAEKIITDIENVRSRRPNLPSQINLANPVDLPSAAYFGGLTDVMLMNLYRMRTGYVLTNARSLQMSREWIDPLPATAIQEAFCLPDLNHFWRRNLTADEIRFSVWSLIGEGSKGVTYYARSLPAKALGYDDMPGALWGVIRTNTDLQLLRDLLRISDVVDGIARTNTRDVSCRTLLCGDRGLVLLLCSTPSALGGDHLNAASWPPRRDVVVSVMLPAGMLAGEVFRVEGGLSVTQVAVQRQSVTIRLDMDEPVAVYRVDSGQMPHHGTSYHAVESPSRDVEATRPWLDARWRRYEDAMLKAGAPLVADAVTDDNRATKAGREMEAAKAQLLSSVLPCASATVRSHRTANVGEIAAAWDLLLRIGCSQTEIMACLIPAAHQVDRLALADAVAHVCIAHGATSKAMDAYALCALDLPIEERRMPFLARMANLSGEAAPVTSDRSQWIRQIVGSGCASDDQTTLKLCGSRLLICGGRPGDAAEILRLINDENARPAVNYYLGRAYLDMGRTGAALACLRECARHSGAHATEAAYLVGIVCVSLQEYGQARAALAVAANGDSTVPYVQDARRVLDKLDSASQGQAVRSPTPLPEDRR